jgi:hypothetical protein
VASGNGPSRRLWSPDGGSTLITSGPEVGEGIAGLGTGNPLSQFEDPHAG